MPMKSTTTIDMNRKDIRLLFSKKIYSSPSEKRVNQATINASNGATSKLINRYCLSAIFVLRFRRKNILCCFKSPGFCELIGGNTGNFCKLTAFTLAVFLYLSYQYSG